ncbi:MAG: hypothetical protein K5876_01355 [Ruminiclostridium sp.]|nr:hypothetical protein [Ruminiclostridium sp.]
MKRISSCIVMLAVMALALTGCSGRSEIPSDWYNETLEYYSDGFEDGWSNERGDLNIADEMKDEDNKFGYLLRDLDGDGSVEVLIGYMDATDITRFIDVFIWHRDMGSFRILHAGDGYYIYLCENNILRMDKWYGSKTTTDYMKYDSSDNSFRILDDETAEPQNCGLTAF